LSKKCIHFSRPEPGAYEGIPRRMKPAECFEHGRAGPGPGFYNIEEVTCMDEYVGLLLDNLIYRFEKIV
jgi:hypothetical protein